MTLEACVLEALNNKQFVAEFDRLNKSNLSMAGSPIELMIDEQSGRLESDMKDFIQMVYETVYKPLALNHLRDNG